MKMRSILQGSIYRIIHLYVIEMNQIRLIFSWVIVQLYVIIVYVLFK